jgi:hypothetical protein
MTDRKWLIMSDLHIPAHDKRAVDLMLQVIDKWKPHEIDIAGDLDDMSCMSRFSKGSADEVMGNLATYAGLTRDFLADLRRKRPKSDIHYHLGNHEIRLEDYVGKAAPALIDTVTYNSLWDLDKSKIEYHHYNKPPVHRHGGLHVHHGMYAVANAGASARKAMDAFNVSVMVGHSHRMGQSWVSYPLADRELAAYEIGHSADINNPAMGYDYKHDWQQGFAVAHIDDNDFPHVQLVRITKDYVCYVDGKRFEG